MNLLTRSIVLSVVLVECLALSGCDLVGIHKDAARVSVNPTVLRVINYYDAGFSDPPTFTNLPRDQIQCAQSTPPTCSVGEGTKATVQNLGSRPLYWESWCDQPLRFNWEAEWRQVTHYACAASGSGTVRIDPGKSVDVPVLMGWEPAGRYRLEMQLSNGNDLIDARHGFSEPFDYLPPASVPVFQCPTENLSALARQIARDALAATTEGHSPPPVRSANNLLLDVERRFPSFGGTYVDRTVFGMWVLPGTSPEPIIAALREIFGQAPTVVKEGAFTFSELIGWEGAIRQSRLYAITSASYEIDHMGHRIRFATQNPWRLPEVECFAAGIGMPDGMAFVDRE